MYYVDRYNTYLLLLFGYFLRSTYNWMILFIINICSQPLALRSYSVEEEKTVTNKCVKRTQSTQERSGSDNEINNKKERKASAASRFTIYKVNKASRKKREKSSAKKERKATKTLAIVLGEY